MRNAAIITGILLMLVLLAPVIKVLLAAVIGFVSLVFGLIVLAVICLVIYGLVKFLR